MYTLLLVVHFGAISTAVIPGFQTRLNCGEARVQIHKALGEKNVHSLCILTEGSEEKRNEIDALIVLLKDISTDVEVPQPVADNANKLIRKLR